jgi:hypothetical protein
MAKVSTQMFFELFEEIVGEEFFEFWDLISKRWLLQRFVSTWMMVSLPVRELFVAFFSLGASSMDNKNFVGNTAKNIFVTGKTIVSRKNAPLV